MTGQGGCVSCPVKSAARSVGAAQVAPRRSVLVIVIPEPGPAAQAVADIETGEGADREASACSVGHEAGLPALVARRVGAARHEAAREQGP